MDYTEGRECDLASHPAHRSHTLIGSPGERARTEEHAEVVVLVRRHNSNRVNSSPTNLQVQIAFSSQHRSGKY